MPRFRTETWTLRGFGCEAWGLKYPSCPDEENAIHILINCSDTQKWREKFFNRSG